MTDRQIFFSGPMVRALIEGRKTQSRRVLKPQPFIDSRGHFCSPRSDNGHDCWGKNLRDDSPCTEAFVKKRVRVQSGDWLWVQEGWRTPKSLDHLSPKKIADRCRELGYRGPWCPRVTTADNMTHQWSEEDGFRDDEPTGRYRWGRHMPRWASRLTLTVTDVRVQRVQEISRGDAMEEGCPFPNMADGDDPRDWYRDYWNMLNAKRDGGVFVWERNPWVVAITFGVEKRNIDQETPND